MTLGTTPSSVPFNIPKTSIAASSVELQTFAFPSTSIIEYPFEMDELDIHMAPLLRGCLPFQAKAHVAIIGAGPRGTSVLERLCSSGSEFFPPGTHLTIHVIDPSSTGPGSVWRTDQSPHLWMNTVASQATMFTDETVVCHGPIRPGPSFYEWSLKYGFPLGPDDYPTRAQFGEYLQWVFNKTVEDAPSNVEVRTHTVKAIRLDGHNYHRQSIVLSNGHVIRELGAVILAQGHLPLVADSEQRLSTTYADRHGLRYFPPKNPADVNLSSVVPGEPVALRGLGLCFFDYMTLLTTGRGGRFITTSDGLRYISSGKEPRLYAGSRRGIPYHARGDNEKGPYGRHEPVILTEEAVRDFRRRARSGHTPDFLNEVWPLVNKEIGTVYYAAILRQRCLGPADFQHEFLRTLSNSPQEAEVLDKYGISEPDRLSWSHIARPFDGLKFDNPNSWRSWLLDYLREDAREAASGNVNGPLKAALDVMRDIRKEIRMVVDHKGLLGSSRHEHLDGWYTPFNAFLSIGPPRRRIEEMIALIEAGVLDVLGPRLEIETDGKAWLARSAEIPLSTVRVTTLIEARLPEISLRRTDDKLLAHLLKTGQCRPHTVDGYETGGLDVTESPFRVIDNKGRTHRSLYAIGVPTEGAHWVTTAVARPGVKSVTLAEIDEVARAVLHDVSRQQSFELPQDNTKKESGICHRALRLVNGVHLSDQVTSREKRLH
ncbi:hypothetical protein INS49_004273 [Diaporthe citri]|uniref:uncharacterized protein n=1 Tax=Diaporthe citri TaxID=83186 RepID=UPI001C8040C0|nr:uncharacterized protein INS49_004273 [Diaporthe citri]KAG6355192.1 hypothetical protein INS49_004273 [Diaporthe citri]